MCTFAADLRKEAKIIIIFRCFKQDERNYEKYSVA